MNGAPIPRLTLVADVAKVMDFIVMSELRNAGDCPGYCTAAQAVDALAAILGLPPEVLRAAPAAVYTAANIKKGMN